MSGTREVIPEDMCGEVCIPADVNSFTPRLNLLSIRRLKIPDSDLDSLNRAVASMWRIIVRNMRVWVLLFSVFNSMLASQTTPSRLIANVH